MPPKKSAPTRASAQQNRQVKRQKLTNGVDDDVQDSQPTYDQPMYQTSPTLTSPESDTATLDGYDTPNDVDNRITIGGKKYTNEEIERIEAAAKQRQIKAEERKEEIKNASDKEILDIINAPISTWGEPPTEADKQAWRNDPVFNRPYFWEKEGGMMAWYADKGLQAKRLAKKQAAIEKEEESARLVAAAEGLTHLRRSTRAPKQSAKVKENSNDLSMASNASKASSKSLTSSPPAAVMESAGQMGKKKGGESPKPAKRPGSSDNDQSAAETGIGGEKGERKKIKPLKLRKMPSSSESDQPTANDKEAGDRVSFKMSVSTEKRSGFILKLKVCKPKA